MDSLLRRHPVIDWQFYDQAVSGFISGNHAWRFDRRAKAGALLYALGLLLVALTANAWLLLAGFVIFTVGEVTVTAVRSDPRRHLA
ncbi:hypothetical protein [Tumebacillus sp. BK434]|uniref:hypothetical protein n=1 Tax=Tumebacillus sp. BK434 TaxID=2512169 RepID=UPI00104B87AC|nr:hypothetical protein [Tumebacillus sp. BK434]